MPKIKIYNTLTRQIEEFVSSEEGIVKMYVCGPTVYDYSHIGHARTYISFDAIKKYFQLRGYKVIHVQNITDIDDKIIKRANQEGKSWKEIADFYTEDYINAIEKLRIEPDILPRVTHHIEDIIDAVKRLIEKGYAYESNGSVYFDVSKYDAYGELSKKTGGENWRQEEEVIKEKKNPFDFALWKKMKEGEPYWESPWGYGRPGWHIECSVMSSKYLGVPIDIHGGGGDLIFPHHENERAQSEALFGIKPWVRYWLHTGMLTIRGEKMSKSLGNIVFLKDLLSKYKPEVIRLWVLSAHYRNQIEFNEELLRQAEANYKRITTAYIEIENQMKSAKPRFSLSKEEIETMNEIINLHREFHRAMSEDFNTTLAFKYWMEATSIYYKKVSNSENLSLLQSLKFLFDEIDRVFDILPQKVRSEGESELAESLIRLLIDVRKALREKGNYELADKIRSELGNIGIQLMDKGSETKYLVTRK
ncbi:cysteine--tRNA ligase [Fervidicoccus sp.]|uniref:cysteine--tRNA ligase n=1 Tax=Fervidicoccus sp. TaxID=2060324 RepID=UPI003C9A9515